MIQFLRGRSTAVADANPILEAGQPLYELDTHRLKVGDGESNYTQLAYVSAEPNYTYGTTDLTAGSSTLATGTLYFVYE